MRSEIPVTLRWVLLALLGLIVAIAVGIAASELTSRRIGLSSEPLRAGDALAPAPESTGNEPGGPGRGEERGEHGGQAQPPGQTTTPVTPPTTTPVTPSTTAPPTTTVPETTEGETGGGDD